uniref:Mpv17-like protein 2 n=1 Tax=Romanomermis culicivorax TaxID=13658 RepID=A0A915JDS0_ROMCU
MNTAVGATLHGLGDILQQNCMEENAARLCHDWRRTGRFMIIGFCLGAFGHKWYGILDRWIKEKTGRALFRKIFVDQVVASPIMNAIFIGGSTLLEGNDIRKTVKEFRRKFPHIYVADWCVWPPAQFVNFYMVSPQLRTVYVSMVDFLWYRYSSYVKHRKDEEVSEKKLVKSNFGMFNLGSHDKVDLILYSF